MKRKLIIMVLSVALTLALIPTIAAYADELDPNGTPVVEDVQGDDDAPDVVVEEETGDMDEGEAVEVELPKINLKSPVTQLSETKIGTQITLVAKVGEKTMDSSLITWTSGDESVATVSADGIVTVVGVGKATITAVMTDGTARNGYAKIFVFPQKNNPADSRIGNGSTGHDVVAPPESSNGKKHK